MRGINPVAAIGFGAALLAIPALAATPPSSDVVTHNGVTIDRHLSVPVRGSAVPVRAVEHRGRITRLYGAGFSTGASAVASAWRFVEQNQAMLGVELADLTPEVDIVPNGHTLPVMHDRATGTYKFTAVYYGQQRGGIPVYGARLTMLVRNAPNNPLVLVNPDTRVLGDFAVDPGKAGAPFAGAAPQLLGQRFPGRLDVRPQRKVIFAGVDDDLVAPRLADECVVIIDGFDKWRVVCDAETGAILHEEPLICTADITGNVAGVATEGIAADICEPEVEAGLPYVLLNSDQGDETFADVDGDYVLPDGGAGFVQVGATLAGRYFEVRDFVTSVPTDSVGVIPPATGDILFNAANDDELLRAQVNGYLQANVVRDFTEAANPSYPTITQGGFPVWTNRTDGFCPGNAWYDPFDDDSPTGVSINFCQSSVAEEHPNTAFSSVVHHEFGHHVVAAGGSGQGQYGEGFGDVISTLILDAPGLGVGFDNDCQASLRTADNDLEYPCGGEIHFCGQLISGCVWDTRNELIVTEPDQYLEILGTLMVNSVLLHSGSQITPDITVDVLTLDDDDGNLLNGTPHYAAINTGFSAHNMPGPALGPLTFAFPDGIPLVLAPGEDTTIRVDVVPLGGTLVTGTVELHYMLDGGNEVVQPMTLLSGDAYEATLPAADCNAEYAWWVSAEATGEGEITDPVDAPTSLFDSLVVTQLETVFLDDFETDEGWTTQNIGADTGDWQRGAPVNDIEWSYDPTGDADGSGSAYTTQNEFGNTDVDEGEVRLTSPPLDLTGPNPTVAYFYFLRLSNEDGSDRLLVEVSPSSTGGPWTTIAVHDTDGGLSWRSHEISSAEIVGAGVPLTASMRFRFTANDADPQSVVEAGLDGFEIIERDCVPPVEPDPCPLDVDDSGDVGFTDLVALLGSWGACPADPEPCPFDAGGDGAVGFTDLSVLLAAWGVCPES